MTTGDFQQRFVRALAKRCGDIMDTTQQADSLQSLMYGFRSLAGIAETYGYYAVTQVSRRCELLCAAAIDQNRALSPFDRARLIAGIVSIRHYGVAS